MRKFISLVLATVFCASYAIAETKTNFLKFQLQVDRYGPVIVGMTPTVASAKLGVGLAPPAKLDKDEESCHYVFPNSNSNDISFMVEDGRITRIDVDSKAIPSTGGIRIGDLEEAAKRAFPKKVKEEIHPYIGAEGKYLIVETKPGYAFIYETDHGKITSFRSGKLSSVRYIEGCL
ncbi:MAG: hypothetical protein Q7R68_00300 [Nitrospirales bacterium]|nr:hypothetical protein [Nitrospirales bacterium]